MAGRPPSAPPDLPGYSPIRLVGSGGYADVFEYEQEMPRRRVAVKVLVSNSLSSAQQRRQFTAEANLMARVSTHPYIVSVFQAAVASDGRPYLVMEFYPGDNFLRRARREQFGVAEVLRVGIQVGSAVATAHKEGILHRDIKPANILTSEFRRPGLTDFGIAAAQGPDVDETEGVSIPWSPPEAFGSGELDVTADVYSLAATLYHLLAGRAPFEVLSGDNSAIAQMARIERSPLPSLSRVDVPPSLERVLSQAMSKNASHRPSTVVAFLRQLQGVEAELQLAVTPLELAEDTGPGRDRTSGDDDDATRVKGVTQIAAQGNSAAISVVPSATPGTFGPAPARRREGLLAEPEVVDTILRRSEPVVAPVPARERTNFKWIVGGAIVLAAAGVALMVAVFTGDTPTVKRQAVDQSEVNDGGDVLIVAPTVDDFAGTVQNDGSFLFEWTAPGSGELAYWVTEDGTSKRTRVTSASYVSATKCILVETQLPTEQLSLPVKGCAP